MHPPGASVSLVSPLSQPRSLNSQQWCSLNPLCHCRQVSWNLLGSGAPGGQGEGRLPQGPATLVWPAARAGHLLPQRGPELPSAPGPRSSRSQVRLPLCRLSAATCIGAPRRRQRELVAGAAARETLSLPAVVPCVNSGENVLLRATSGHSRAEIRVGGPSGQDVILPSHLTLLVDPCVPR